MIGHKRNLKAQKIDKSGAGKKGKKVARRNEDDMNTSDSEDEHSTTDSEAEEYETGLQGRDTSVMNLTSQAAMEVAANIKAKRLSYDKKARGDENGMKNTLLYAVWSNNYHKEGTQADNFKQIAAEFAESKPMGISTFSADSLAKKYKEILKDVQNSIFNNYIGGEDSDDITKRTKFSGTMEFERIGRRILRETQDAKELKRLARTEKAHKDNTLSSKEDAVLQRMQGSFTPSFLA